MQIKGNRFLVIGGAGFIGSHVVDQLLSEGAAHVRVYDNFSRGTHINLQEALRDVRDCAGANILAMHSIISNRYYNVGTSVKTSIRELVSKIGELYPRRFDAQFKEFDSPFVRNRVGATRRAAEEIAFKANIPLGQGLRELIHWHANQNKKVFS
ncbi:NAD-dependent epimerase/dehydratase family protein [Methylotuvimicrobium sp.]|uniref:NAD-dependent epimerase/dehydratase family protein n=1 Tax=Methylotuvimicrobium sp. TaxID=2822413 RepID=UPI003D661B0E